MAASNRSTLLTKTHKVLKKHYKPVHQPSDRPVLEQLLFGCCLENASYEAAEQAYAALEHNFFDWNEVRVSSVKELTESMDGLPDPTAAAGNVKRVLQNVFESTYSFELESLRKLTLGQAVTRLEKFDGATPFCVAHVTQHALGGHSIPVDRGALDALLVIGAVTDAEAAHGTVPGLERAIPKTKGPEFGSLLHQLSAEFVANPYSPKLHKVLLEISPDAKQRLPKRPSKKARKAEPADAPEKTAAGKKRPPAAKAASGPKKKTAAKKKAAAGKSGKKSVTKGKKPTPAKTLRRKPR
jgi:endonuclease-3